MRGPPPGERTAAPLLGETVAHETWASVGCIVALVADAAGVGPASEVGHGLFLLDEFVLDVAEGHTDFEVGVGVVAEDPVHHLEVVLLRLYFPLVDSVVDVVEPGLEVPLLPHRLIQAASKLGPRQPMAPSVDGVLAALHAHHQLDVDGDGV